MGRSGHPHVHSPRRVRRLRGLRSRLQLHGDRTAGDRIRAQTAHQPVELQQGLFLRRRFLSELRDCSWGTLAQSRRRDASEPLPAGDPGSGLARNGRALQRAGGRHRRLGRRHNQPDARRRRLSRRAFQLQSRSDRPEPEIRRGHRARSHGARAGRAARDPDRLGRGRRADRLRPHRRRGRRMRLEAHPPNARGDLGRSDADRRFRAQSKLERRRGTS